MDTLTLEETYGKYQSWTGSMNAEVRNTDTGKVLKKFHGESAWSDANRLADDLAVQDRIR